MRLAQRETARSVTRKDGTRDYGIVWKSATALAGCLFLIRFVPALSCSSSE
ncbi:MAG: hypothetical protein FWH27_12325 [Planctomycetaceae bacterium]|nr:hypothetical protein [Planctomycetaceae bacterium]